MGKTVFRLPQHPLIFAHKRGVLPPHPRPAAQPSPRSPTLRAWFNSANSKGSLKPKMERRRLADIAPTHQALLNRAI
ncbi:hypothetical protein [Kingella oralis]|uniref:hypothetical protein n=1 Tax=Kingella oralis TaxID=505 RepID=UPI0034E4153E